MYRYALRNIVRKPLRTGLVTLILFVLMLSSMLISGIISAREGLLRSVLQQNLSGACMLTTYRGPSAGFDWLSAVSPALIPAGVFQELDAAGAFYSPRLRIGGLQYLEDGGWSFLVILGVQPERERRITTGIRIIRGAYPSSGGRQIALPDTYARDKGLAPGQDVTLFLRIDEGHLLPFAFTLSGTYASDIEDVLGIHPRIALVEVTSLQAALGLKDGSYSDVAFPDERNLYRQIAGRESLSFVPAEKTVQASAGFIAFLSTINTLIQVITVLVLLAALINTVLMQVLERKREIGTLFAIGCPPRRLTATIVIEYLVMDAAALLLSCGVYLLVVAATALIPGTPRVSFAARGVVSAAVISTLVLIAGIAYPCYKASRISVTDVLREDS